MAKRARIALIGGVLVGAMLLMGAGFPTRPTKTTPAHFANGVCITVAQWSTAAQAGSAQLDTQLNEASNLREVRDWLASYLADTAQLTTLALDGLDDAGVPSTPKGAAVSKVLKTSFKDIRSALRGFHDDAEDVSIKDQKKALKQLKALNVKVGIEFSSVTKALAKIRTLDPNHKLEKAFKANAVCTAL